ncbi:MAG TPA: PrsW family glutamic-type intramembrane protease [Dehalococcoidia bacterium]|nr:PrsW family glutamic-type intramembrane protease [Dehalococcoidia bacterium]
MRLMRARWVQILGVGLILFVLANLALSFTGDVLYFPTVMMIGAFLVPAAFVAYFYQQENLFDRGVHAGSILPTLMLCVLFGGLIGTLAAGSLEYTVLSSNSPLSLAWVGPIEEFAKLIVPVAVFIIMRNRFRSELDGLLFGVATGMAFAALETMGYGLVALVSSHGSLAALDQAILIRGLLSPAGHAAWTGLITATLWRERERTGKAFTPLVLGFFLVAAVLHSLWDLTGSSGSLFVMIPSYLAIGGGSLTLLFWRLREARHAVTIAPVPSA